MPTSQTTTLSKPTDDERVPIGTLAYFQARNRARLYETVINEFERSNISQATLARRLGKRPEVVSRFLAAPGNWEIDSVSDYLFAMSGAETEYAISQPLDGAYNNNTQPDWVTSTNSIEGSAQFISVTFSGTPSTLTTAASGNVQVILDGTNA
jgi:hypothetical protein